MDQYKGSDVDKYRSFMSGEGEKNTVWKDGAPPNYDAVNKLFEEGRTKIWPAGSLEEQVQNLVKTWEMESVHKLNPQDKKSVDATKLTVSVNGRKPLTAEEVRKIGGGYNNFLQTSLPKELRVYNPDDETFDTSTKTFTTTFERGFALEVLEVYSGPPVIAYKFRHWAYMDGPFKGHPPTHELVEMFGVSIIEIVDDMRFTVSHVVEPVERGLAKINRTFHEISENVKRQEDRRRGPKDDSYLIPLNSWTKEFSEVHEDVEKGSFSDSNLSNGRRQPQQTKTAFS